MGREISTPSWILWGAILFVAAVLTSATHVTDESALRTAVLTGYEYKIRPDTTVTVTGKLSLLNINHLDVPGQRLSVAGWLTLAWTDSRITWTPATYGGIEEIYDTELVLWRPEVIVDNSITTLDILESDKLLIRAEYTGAMTWEPPGIYETHCDVDITYYPFDTQICVVEVTSWAYTVTEVDMTVTETEIYLEDYEESGEWDILKTWTERRLLIDGAITHSQIDFFLKVRRKPSYYITTILIPVIVTSLLCTLVFLLPADSGEKVGYSLTVLLTYTVMLTLVASYMPPTSKHVSVLSVYLTIILFVGVFTTLLTVLVLYCHHQDPEREIPDWILRFANSVMIPAVCWSPDRLKGAAADDEPSTNGNGVTGVRPQSTNRVTPSRRTTDSRAFTLPRAELSDEKKVGIGGKIGDDDYQRHKLGRTISGSDGYSHKVDTWQGVANVLDSFCFRYMGLFVVVLTFIILLVLIVGGYTA